MADTLLASVPFAVAADAPASDDGDFVVKHADVVFKAGRYDFPPDAGGPFEMTADELKAALSDLPAHGVPITDEHNPRSVFYRRGIGRFRDAKPSPDFAHFGGEVRIARPLAEFLGPGPLRLSANWCRATKRLKDVSLTETPRIPEAAAFAAYAAFAKAEGASAETTPHGRARMQMIHDTAAEGGAVCKGAKKPPADAGMAQFTSSAERDAFQAVHDTAAGMGASCNVSGGKAREKGEEAMAAYSAEFGPPPSPREKELEARLAKIEAERQSEREAAARAEEARFSAAVASFAEDGTREAMQLFREGYVLPTALDTCIAGYIRAQTQKLRGAAEVRFTNPQGKEVVSADPVAEWRATWRRGEPHRFTKEELQSRGAGEALFAANDGPRSEQEKRVAEAKQHAEAWGERNGKG